MTKTDEAPTGNIDDWISAVPRVMGLSRATLRMIQQDSVWACLYNVRSLPLAAGALIPSLGVTLPPAVAASPMEVGSVSVVTNLRLR